jgi:hypothetical protein
MIRRCLNGELFGEPCDDTTPDGELCDPCARRRLLGALARQADAIEDAYLVGYAQGWEDRTGRSSYGDLDGLAEYLRTRPS